MNCTCGVFGGLCQHACGNLHVFFVVVDQVGDQILQINNVTTDSMTHTEAIDIIQSGGSSVHLLMKRTGKPPPAFGMPCFLSSLSSTPLLPGGRDRHPQPKRTGAARWARTVA